jgi:CRISPR-associated protein Cas2
MPMTIVVTRNVRERFRGYLASAMCELAPGVYTAPRMTAAVRDRVWAVLESWFVPDEDASLLMTWPDSAVPGGQIVRTLGTPSAELVDHDGVYLARRELTMTERETLGLPDSSGDVPF